ncbi:putative non-specific serine/threonine protein kinase [Helianthus anomalus]
MRLVDWVWDLYGTGTLLEAVDPCLQLKLNFEEEEIKRLMIVGLWCSHPDAELRPSIRQAIKVLNSEASLPLQPSKIPVASYTDFSNISRYGLSSGSLNTNLSKQTTSTTNYLLSHLYHRYI